MKRNKIYEDFVEQELKNPGSVSGVKPEAELIGRVDGFHGDSIRVIVETSTGHAVHWFSVFKSPACRVGDGVKLARQPISRDWYIAEVGDLRLVP